MKWLTPFRAASALLAIFCVMHTLGGMLAQKSLGAASDAVFASMKQVHFVFNGADTTWYGFWFGFGLTVSAYLALSAVMAWKLGAVSPESWSQVSSIAWALIASHLFNTVLSWKYFFAAPGVFGVLISALLVVGTIQKRRQALSVVARG